MRYLAIALACASGLAVSSQALAADGTITFRGEVTTNTCGVNAGQQDFTVTLPKVNANHFTGVQSSTAQTRFTIDLTGCNNVQARAYFEANANSIDYSANALKNTDTGPNAAQGIGFALWDEQGSSRINLGVSGQQTTFQPLGATELPYEVSYLQYQANVAPGTVGGSVLYTLDYQ